ncbi:MAG: hypothetical protein HUU10_10505 [Bacteroidetes bacterium]|nr:hypothetical protein [Bacteroidota bacterium]
MEPITLNGNTVEGFEDGPKPSKQVVFRVLQLVDGPKSKSELLVGENYIGELEESGKRVFYTDMAKVDWIFYVGDTCEIVYQIADNDPLFSNYGGAFISGRPKPKHSTKSLYDRWNDGEIGNFGSFQTTILQAYRIADNSNRERLEMAYPEWFTTETDKKPQPKMASLNYCLHVNGDPNNPWAEDGI